MLHTTKEIADIYGGNSKNVTPYMITHTWIPNGLKFIKGKGNSYLFKTEWVEQYIEQTSIIRPKANNIKISKKSRNVMSKNCFVY